MKRTDELNKMIDKANSNKVREFINNRYIVRTTLYDTSIGQIEEVLTEFGYTPADSDLEGQEYRFDHSYENEEGHTIRLLGELYYSEKGFIISKVS